MTDTPLEEWCSVVLSTGSGGIGFAKDKAGEERMGVDEETVSEQVRISVGESVEVVE